MKRFLPCAAFVLLAGLSTAGKPQLVEESIRDGHRLCTYRGSAGDARSPNGRRTARIGFGETCPGVFPQRTDAGAAPPSAMLASENADGQGRRCTYEQGGYSWLVTLPLDRLCPPAAGMLAQAAGSAQPGRARPMLGGPRRERPAPRSGD